MRDYAIDIFYSEEDGGYIANIPTLPMCSAFGNTPEEALRQLRVAQEAWLAAARKEGLLPEDYQPGEPVIIPGLLNLYDSRDIT
ncbi:MAG: hypothetical protein BWY76_01632 [bacterium ADurb.Bin429]|nr:MAG: hypothetical protein BWY76_01632 [bacterium ADurb.Bin429]